MCKVFGGCRLIRWRKPSSSCKHGLRIRASSVVFKMRWRRALQVRLPFCSSRYGSLFLEAFFFFFFFLAFFLFFFLLSSLLLSSSTDERDGFFRLAECFRFGIGCEHSLSRAKDLFHRAGELGHLAALEISGLLEECPVKKFTWLGRAARKGNVVSFLHQFAFGASHSSAALFVIGRALNGHVNVEAGTVFGQETSSNIFRLSLRAVAFYSAQLEAAKCTVNAWSLVGIRLKVVKDIRILIGKLVWDAREEASYEL
jgi:hypothetical protein